MPVSPETPYLDDAIDADSAAFRAAATKLEQLLRGEDPSASSPPAPGVGPGPTPAPMPRQRPGIARDPSAYALDALMGGGEPSSRAIVDALRGREAIAELGMGGGEALRQAAAPVLQGARQERASMLTRDLAGQRARTQATNDALERRTAQDRILERNAREDRWRDEQTRQREKDRDTQIRAARIASGDKKAAEETKKAEEASFSAYASPSTVPLTPGSKTDLVTVLDNGAVAQDNWAELYTIAEKLEKNSSPELLSDFNRVASNLITKLNKVAGLGALSGPDMQILERASAGGDALEQVAKDRTGLARLKRAVDKARQRSRNDIVAKIGAVGSRFEGAKEDAFSDSRWAERVKTYQGVTDRESGTGSLLQPGDEKYLPKR